jgi:hypothetical protein
MSDLADDSLQETGKTIVILSRGTREDHTGESLN